MDSLNLKCTGVKLFGDRQTWRRWRKTVKFILKYGEVIHDSKPMLDIGPANQFGRNVAKEFNLVYYDTSNIDLDSIDGKSYLWTEGLLFDTILCSHVIEHLYNPGRFLEFLKYSLCGKHDLFIMYPRTPRFLWNNRHFHEYSRKAFLSLIDYSGYEVVAYETHRGWHDWWFYLTGFRPFIRFWCTVFNWHNNEYYLLRIK